MNTDVAERPISKAAVAESPRNALLNGFNRAPSERRDGKAA
jgi:hypothetical protein